MTKDNTKWSLWRFYRRKEFEILSLIQTTFKKNTIPSLNKICECGLKPIQRPNGVWIVKEKGKPARIICERCQSTRGCPVCRSVYLGRKQRTGKKIFKNAIANGYHLVMVSFTQPYIKGEALLDVKDKHSRAKRAFKSGSSFQQIIEKIGLLGVVGAYHVKVNDHGVWNVHSHEIWILKSVKKLKKLQGTLLKMWLMQCKKLIPINNIRSFKKHSLDFEFGKDETAVKYLYKMFDKKITGDETATGYDVFSLLNSNIPNRKELFLEYLACNIGHLYFITKDLNRKVQQKCLNDEAEEQTDSNRKRTHRNESNLTNEKDVCTESFKKNIKHTDENELETENSNKSENAVDEDTCFSAEIPEDVSDLSEADNPKETAAPLDEDPKIFYLPEQHRDYICRHGTIIADILDYVDDHEEEISAEEFKEYIHLLMDKAAKGAISSSVFN